MSHALALWHTDHTNFGVLLELLEDQLVLFEKCGTPDYDMMLDIMYYMTHYADALHHPKEGLAFAAIRTHVPEAATQIDELVRQHAGLNRAGRDIVRELDDIVNGSIVSRERIDALVAAYIKSFRAHMALEETDILPLAERSCTLSDWKAVTAASDAMQDPLFGPQTEPRYANLREQIAREARLVGKHDDASPALPSVAT